MSSPSKAQPPGPRGGLSATSSRWIEQGDPEARKARGQYMTPRAVAEALLDRISLGPGMKVLDPGVGTGELLRAALDREPELVTSGWDVDETAIEAARQLVPEAELQVLSALESFGGPAGFDLVLGNPPYFQLKLDRQQKERFAGVISGRANIFALFFQIGIEQLRPGGILAYIVPPSMNSGAYFEALREYLVASAEVTDLTILEGTDWFEGANTAVQLLVLRKSDAGPSSSGRGERTAGSSTAGQGFVFRREVPEAGFRRVILTADPERLESEFEGRRTLWELGLEASTGQVIWNENRGRLKAEAGPGRIPLVWSHSIGEGELRVSRDDELGARAGRPAFYDSGDGGREPLTGPAIVVNRVVGAVGRGELRAALIPDGFEFLAENHVNVIRPRKTGGSRSLAVDWEKVLKSLSAPGVAGRVRLLTGNTQISARELTHLLPLD